MKETKIGTHIKKMTEGKFLATSADVLGLVAECWGVVEAAEIGQGLARKIAESVSSTEIHFRGL